MPVYKDKKKGTWFASFYYTDWTGTRKKKKREGFKTQREAKAFEREYIKREEASCDMAFGSLVELYMSDCSTRLRATTYAGKEYLINTRILPTFKDMPINTITPATVRKWQNDLLASKQQYAPTYLKTINNQLSAIFNYAKKYYSLTSNPAAICGSIGKKHAESMQFWTLDEFKTVLSNVENPTTKIMMEILFWTGMRSGELLALTMNDIDLADKYIHIRKSYARIGAKDIISEPKTPKSKRSITIPDFLCSDIQEYADRLYDYRPGDRLFELDKYHLHNEMKRICKKTGIKKIRVHDLRHSHASLLIELGFSPLLISERLGHENVQTTLQTYAHLYPNKHGEVAQKLDELNK